MPIDPTIPTPSAEQVLSDPCASRWLKQALREALKRDPVDAANDAELLYHIMAKREDAPPLAGLADERSHRHETR